MHEAPSPSFLAGHSRPRGALLAVSQQHQHASDRRVGLTPRPRSPRIYRRARSQAALLATLFKRLGSSSGHTSSASHIGARAPLVDGLRLAGCCSWRRGAAHARGRARARTCGGSSHVAVGQVAPSTAVPVANSGRDWCVYDQPRGASSRGARRAGRGSARVSDKRGMHDLGN